MAWNPRVSNGHRRRQVRAQVLREESICHLCGGEVDKSLPAGLPGSPELDEIIPVSKGGSPYDRENIRLAHRLHNQQRQAKDLFSPQQRPVIKPFITDRTW